MLRFGEFAFDAEARALTRDGERVHLSPKCFDLLGLLLSERPRAVPKRLIQERLWPETFVSESNLTKLMAELRAALGDDSQRPRFVRTLHRVGYVFCGSVIEASRGEGARCVLSWGEREIELPEGESLIGRSSQAAVRIRSPAVSRRHARILVRGGEATLEDLGSRNGTYLAGRRLDGPVRLRDGDAIGVGSCSLVFTRESGEKSTLSGVGSPGKE